MRKNAFTSQYFSNPETKNTFNKHAKNFRDWNQIEFHKVKRFNGWGKLSVGTLIVDDGDLWTKEDQKAKRKTIWTWFVEVEV